MTEILITEYLDPWAVEDLQRDFDVVYDPNLVDRPEALAARQDFWASPQSH